MSPQAIPVHAVTPFVREVLGCGCPDEVFQSIDMDECPADFSDLPEPACLLAIGNRLLVLLVETGEPEHMIDLLDEYFMRGKKLRDSGGFNRFRLVVVTAAVQRAKPLLEQHFEHSECLDDRLHLHVIAPEQVPKDRRG